MAMVGVEVAEVVVVAMVEVEVEAVVEKTPLRNQQKNLTKNWIPITLRP